MKRPILLLSLIALAACGNPREECIDAAGAELRVIDQLIAETEENIDRGYTFETRPASGGDIRFCAEAAGPFNLCAMRKERTEERPVAIDVAAETAKLRSLISRRVLLQRQVDRDIAACRAAYPAR